MNILGFFTDNHYVDNESHVINNGFELSTQSRTYTKDIAKYSQTNSRHKNFHVFSSDLTDNSNHLRKLTTAESDAIFYVIDTFLNHSNGMGVSANKNQLIANVLNTLSPNIDETLGLPVMNLDYTGLIEVERLFNPPNENHTAIAPKEIQFSIGSHFSVRIWLSDSAFQGSYPLYEADLVLPFDDDNNKFQSLLTMAAVIDPVPFIEALSNVNPEVMSVRLEEARADDLGGGNRIYTPSTSRVINVPFKRNPAVGTGGPTDTRYPCYFGFNIYGMQGSYGDILREKIRDFLKSPIEEGGLGWDDEKIDMHFPTLNQVNEYFFIPRWDRVAVSNQINHQGIFSHVIPIFHDDFSPTDYFSVYGEDSGDYLDNTPDPSSNQRGPNVFYAPLRNRNTLLTVINGKYTEVGKRIFWEYFDDFITENSAAIDIGLIKLRTRRLIETLERLVEVGVKQDSLQAYNKALSYAPGHHISLRKRNNVEYIVTKVDGFYLYLMPSYEFLRIREELGNGD